ncbi:MAG: hypothetical protein M1833_007396 [Piccolia ochrophora]|nr:MAG: hypothetical protein M1833_007396 [Piccolia ochrophora]
MLLNPGRVVVRQLLANSKTSSTIPLRVIGARNVFAKDPQSFCVNVPASLVLLAPRSYATRSASKPATASKAKTSVKKKPATKKASTVTKKTTPKKKPAQKPKKKTAAKPKAKPRKKVLTEAQQAAAATRKSKEDIKRLKVAILSEPKRLPSTAYLVLNDEMCKATKGLATKESSARYRSFSPEQREHYNHIANQNKATNEKAYKQWVQSHTPTEIRTANNARRLLKRRLNKTRQYAPIKDDRLPSHPAPAYAEFFKDRTATGDFQGMKAGESAKVIGKEWRSAPESEKQVYYDTAARSMARYEAEMKTVLNRTVSHATKPATA